MNFNSFFEGSGSIFAFLGRQHTKLYLNFIFYRYYLGTLPDRPDVRHLFKVPDASTHQGTYIVRSECLSCNKSVQLNNLTTIISDKDNISDQSCQFNTAHLSKDFSFYVLDCQGPSMPQTFVYSLPQNQLVKVLDTNDELQEIISGLAMPQVRFLQFNISEDIKTPARVKLLIPPGQRQEEEFTFPLVLKV